MSTINRTTTNTKAFISPVDKNDPNTLGILNDNIANVLSIRFVLIHIYEINAFIVGTIAHGTKKTGFNIIGKPKVTGSLIPKNAGNTLIRPTVFIVFDLEKQHSSAMERHAPVPPIHTKYTQKDSVNIEVAANPDACCAALVERFMNMIGPINPQNVAL